MRRPTASTETAARLDRQRGDLAVQAPTARRTAQQATESLATARERVTLTKRREAAVLAKAAADSSV
jgi:hypothetical protein